MSAVDAKLGRLRRAISDDDVERFERDGVVCIRDLFDPAWIEILVEATERYLAGGPRRYDLSGDRAGVYVGCNFLWLDDEGFDRFVHHSPAAEIAARLMRSSTATLYHDTVLVKEPGAEATTPWHQDRPYYPFDGDQLCGVWLALDRVTHDSGALEYVRGSHRWGAAYHPERFGHVGTEQLDLAPVPDIEARRGEFDIVSFEVEPGDCLVHHGLTIHGSGGNSTRRRRRAVITRWLGDDVTYAGGPLSERHPYDCGLVLGDRPACELFPLVWSQRSG